MWKIHVTLALLGATAGLIGCAAGPAAEMPQGVALAGNWKLNRAASDDPQVVIARMRAQALKIIRRASAPVDTGLPPGDRRGGPPVAQPADQNGPLSEADAADTSAPGSHTGRRPDPLRRSPMMHTLADALARGDFLGVRASSEEFVLDYGTTVRRFTPGAHSVVSSELGVADQQSGWKGRQYVINIRAQLGPNVVETYGLSADGQHLIENLKIGPAELPAIELKRVYDRTTETAPRALTPTD
ncbi:MAG: hypothetical protein ACLPTM_06785 [Steroidobacteraceae bacterium]